MIGMLAPCLSLAGAAKIAGVELRDQEWLDS